MATQKLPSPKILWERHVSRYSDVFSEALRELSKLDSISGDEDAISEMLCPLLSKVCFNFNKARNIELQTPFWEASIQPSADYEIKGGKIKKRPDFTCKWMNPWADSHERYEISLHIECKLLGVPTSESWILNKNYVTNGIKRFDSKDHEYGKRATTGIMIGYIISMKPEDIENEVNSYQEKYLSDNKKIKFLFNTSIPFKTRQNFNRKNIMPSQFELIHLWIDLRKCYLN